MPFSVQSEGIGGRQTAKHELMMENGLNIFDPVHVEGGILSGQEVEFAPIAPVFEDNPIEFVVPGEALDRYIIPNSLRLRGYYQIVKKNGGLLEEDDDVAAVNNCPHSFFKAVNYSINGTQLNDQSSSTYAYRAYLEHLLSFSRGGKKSHLITSGWMEDTLNRYNTTNHSNEGYEKRKNLAKLSMKVYFETSLIIDFCQTEKMFLGGQEIRLELVRSSNEFALMGPLAAAHKYKVLLGDVKLSLRRVTVSQQVTRRNQALLLKEPAVYPTTSVRIKTFNVPAGLNSTFIPNIARGTLPSSLFIFLLKGIAFSGSIAENPFNIEPHSLSQIHLVVNGDRVPASSSYTPDFESRRCMREYSALLGACGITEEASDNGVSLDLFRTNATIYGFDLTPDQCHGFHTHKGLQGNIDLDISFSTSPAFPLQVLVYATFPAVFQVGRNNKTTLVEL